MNTTTTTRGSITRMLGAACAGAAIALIGAGALSAAAQDGTPPHKLPPAGVTQPPLVATPDDSPQPPPAEDVGATLIKGLQETRGCLGVEVGLVKGGKSVIFAWFENKAAAKRWFNSDVHQKVMHDFFPETAEEDDDTHRPLTHAPDDIPLLIVASVTSTEGLHRGPSGEVFPISQFAIEIYTPVPGGLSMGGRFAPDALRVPRLRELKHTPAQ